MSMSRQEKHVQLQALAKEIEGHETAISNLEVRQSDAEGRDDESEAKRFAGLIQKSERSIAAAKEQMALLSGGAKTPQQRGSKRA